MDSDPDVGITTRPVDPTDHDDLTAAAGLRHRWWLQDRGSGDPDRRTFAEELGPWLAARPDTHRGVFVEVDGAIVGVGWVVLIDRLPWPDDDAPRAGLLQAVFVDSPARGGGAGAALIGGLLDVARTNGLKYVLVNPTERSEPLYRRLGFGGADPPLRLDLREDGT